MLEKYINEIKPLDENSMGAVQNHLNGLVKPPGSLGELESIAVRLGGISGELFYDTSKRCVIIFAADNGVVEEGVSSAPQEVTKIQTENFGKGITGVAVLTKLFKSDLIVVDVGINGEVKSPGVLNKKIRNGTWNISKEAAMTRDEAVAAVLNGIDTVVNIYKDGYKLVGVGEMGIGNTTTSAAVLCSLLDITHSKAAGKGAGLTEENYRRKLEIIQTALDINKPDSADVIDVLAKVGGFDIAAMAGAYVGAAYLRLPVVIDGFISIVAALCATRLNPLTKEFMSASHFSSEQGYRYAQEALGIPAPLNLGMRLGEGSGCPLMFALIDSACAILRDMGTFEQGGIGDEYLEEVRDADFYVAGHKDEK